MSDVVTNGILSFCAVVLAVIIGQLLQTWRENRDAKRKAPQVKADYAKALRDLADETTQDYTEVMKQMREMRATHTQEIEAIKASHSKEIEDMKASHAQEVAELRHEIALAVRGILHLEIDVSGTNPPKATITKSEYTLPVPVGVGAGVVASLEPTTHPVFPPSPSTPTPKDSRKGGFRI